MAAILEEVVIKVPVVLATMTVAVKATRMVTLGRKDHQRKILRI
jgi:hypothetical protein